MAKANTVKKSAAAYADKPRRDIYAEVTAKIIAQLEAGTLPWVQPWSKGNRPANVSLPYNASTGRAYSGVDVLMLWGEQLSRGYRSAGWLTFKQALELGGNVRKGEKGTTVVYASRFVPAAERAKPVEDQRVAAMLKAYTVFNVEQCDNLPERLSIAAEPVSAEHQVEAAEALIKRTGADFRIGGDKAFYVPALDYIQVPPQPAFREPINYYRTCFHELGHWTGHKSRLDRSLMNSKGTKDYAREELVAEMSSAFVCASLGIEPTVRHADYIGAWLQVLREDNRAVFKAASLASKAASFILGDAEIVELHPDN